MSCASAPASAAGFWLLERGASSYARGGANVADPRDPSALYVNPSGLAGLTGLQLHVDANMVFDMRAFTRASDDLDSDGDLTDYDAVENQWGPTVPSPSIFVTWNLATLGLARLTLGAGVWGPPLVDRDWDPDGAQRYSEISAANRQAHYGLGAGVALPWWGLRLGATAMLIDQRIVTTQKMSTSAAFGAQPERSGFDVLIDVDAKDAAIFNGILSISAQPVPWFIVAASYQPPYNVRAQGKAKLVLGDQLAGLAEVSGDEIGIALDPAAIARVAARVVDPEDSWDVELAWVFEGWGRAKRVRFLVKDLSVSIPGRDLAVSDVDIPYHWRDTWSLRAGGSYLLIPETLRLRAGAYYERAAVAPEWVTLGSMDFDKVGVTAGGRLDVSHGVWLDLALGVAQHLAGTIDDSRHTMPNVLPVAGESNELWSVTNGDYEVRQIFVLFAAGIAFDV